ncbi:hypothetical protein Sa4125_14160 [Aureimonas sp. SA4125]|uniref:aKG-HExxH-type peptide beta-hydroxylase n=1 Tax=Aureimonas sp. SA4125 TaxID=2826993 RepID=UPI001CC701C6|nr:HEXXH motif-containing putative peptide modification protein [Aureimonas sp. SA4125]BDA83874.1 hypothetical protein Sa4125_14160 [Aureimonas sp. SA4125]
MSALSSLATVIEWREGADAAHLDKLDALRINLVAGALASALSRPAIRAGLSPHLNLLPQISPNAADRIFQAPAVCQAVRLNDAGQLAATVKAEIVFDLCPDEHVESWTALGDAWLGLYGPVASPVRLRMGADGRLRGPSLAAGIPVDLASPLLLQHPAAGLDAGCAVSADVGDATICKLDEAATLIEAISPPAWSAVRRFTANLVLRQDGRSPPAFRSASSAAAIGRCVLVNAGSSETSPAEIAEGLVHETVHALASCAEIEAPIFLPIEGEIRGDVRSPWTGALLHQHAFLHACIVWFAIQRFWEAALTAGILPGHAGRRVDQIRAGFKRLETSTCQAVAPAALLFITDLKGRATGP